MSEVPEKKAGAAKKIGMGCLIMVAIIVVLVVIGAIVGDNKTGSKSADGESAAEAATAVTAAELSTAFQENEAKAKLAYGGKTLRVTGKVKGIDLDFSDAPVIKLAGAGEVQGMGVSSEGKMTDVNINGLPNEAAAQVTKGTAMTFLCKGDVTEVMGSPQLSDCTIVQQ